MKVSDLANKLRLWAPEHLQEDWDHSGWQLRFSDKELHHIVVAMDVTEDVVDLAKNVGAELILTHHPFLFEGIQLLEDFTMRGKMVTDLVKNTISVYSAHTSMDKAKGGVNDQWISKLGLNQVRVLSDVDDLGIMGENKLSIEELKAMFQSEGIPNIRAYGRKKDVVETIGFVGGSGASYIEEAAFKGCDVLITGDVKHHDGQRAYELGIMVVDIGHFQSEKAILEAMALWAEEESHATVHLIMNSPFVFEL